MRSSYLKLKYQFVIAAILGLLSVVSNESNMTVILAIASIFMALLGSITIILTIKKDNNRKDEKFVMFAVIPYILLAASILMANSKIDLKQEKTVGYIFIALYFVIGTLINLKLTIILHNFSLKQAQGTNNENKK